MTILIFMPLQNIMSLSITTIPINNISKAELNTLHYGEKGSVKFASGTPIALRIPFLKEGSGENLAKYHTYLSLDKDKNMINISVEEVPKLYKKLLYKLGLTAKKTKLSKSIDYLQCNSSIAIKELKSFISSGEIDKFFKEMKTHRKIANYLISLI